MQVTGNRGEILSFPVRQVKCLGVGRGQPLYSHVIGGKRGREIMKFIKAFSQNHWAPTSVFSLTLIRKPVIQQKEHREGGGDSKDYSERKSSD